MDTQNASLYDMPDLWERQTGDEEDFKLTKKNKNDCTKEAETVYSDLTVLSELLLHI